MLISHAEMGKWRLNNNKRGRSDHLLCLTISQFIYLGNIYIPTNPQQIQCFWKESNVVLMKPTSSNESTTIPTRNLTIRMTHNPSETLKIYLYLDTVLCLKILKIPSLIFYRISSKRPNRPSDNQNKVVLQLSILFHWPVYFHCARSLSDYKSL